MQKALTLGILSLFLMLPVSADAAARTKARTKARVDYNCRDFSSQSEAQSFFIKSGGPKNDPYRLDADKDGIACENLK